MEDELDALRAIYPDELQVATVDAGVEVCLLLRPCIAGASDSDGAAVLVKATLWACLPQGYPQTKPIVQLREVRGLDEACVQKLLQQLVQCVETHAEQPVLFDLIETVRDTLSENNCPTGECPVCLLSFEDIRGVAVVRTACFHCFHAVCLRGAIQAQEQVFEAHARTKEKLSLRRPAAAIAARPYCPICRVPLDDETLNSLRQDAVGAAIDHDRGCDSFEISAEMRNLQSKMSQLLERQKAVGGLIDVEENQRRLFVSNTIVALPHPKPPT